MPIVNWQTHLSTSNQITGRMSIPGVNCQIGVYVNVQEPQSDTAVHMWEHFSLLLIEENWKRSTAENMHALVFHRHYSSTALTLTIDSRVTHFTIITQSFTAYLYLAKSSLSFLFCHCGVWIDQPETCIIILRKFENTWFTCGLLKTLSETAAESHLTSLSTTPFF